MLPLLTGLAPLITGGASLLGSIFGSQTSAANTQAQIGNQQQMLAESEQFNAGQATQQMEFQQDMSNTAYQRASADMKDAGLNPMMMFGSGGAASAPSGASASIGTPSAPMPQKSSPFAGLGDAAKTAMATAVQSKQIDLLTEEAAKAKTDAALTQRTIDVDQPAGQRQLTDAETAAAASTSRLTTQSATIRAFEERTGKLFSSLPPAAQDALVTGKAVLNAAGDLVGIGAAAGIGRAISRSTFTSGSSARAPVTDNIVNEVPGATAVRAAMDKALRINEEIRRKASQTPGLTQY